MDILEHARRRAFSLWLRTGRLPGWAKPRGTEVKYNPWHDADDGRFTFKGQGRYFGRGASRGSDAGMHEKPSERRRRRREPEPYGGYGGGGDGFNGGGATGGDEAFPDPKSRRDRSQQPTEPRSAPIGTDLSPEARVRAYARRYRQSVDNPRNWRRVEANGYIYRIDALGRTRQVSGTITENPTQRRSRSAQLRAGGQDRRASDQGGHYIARRFNGPTEAFNHFAQDGTFNRRSYQALENQWAAARRRGRRVTVSIVPLYEGSSRRPSFIEVSFRIDGKFESLKFPNEPQEGANAKR